MSDITTFPQRKRGRRFTYPEEVREAAVRDLMNPDNIFAEISQKYGVPMSTLQYWVERAKKSPGALNSDRGDTSHTDAGPKDTASETAA